MVKNRVVRISLQGGLLGLIFTKQKRREAIGNCIKRQNEDGWRFVFGFYENEHDYLLRTLHVLILGCTLFLWTFNLNYLIVFEKDEN